MLPDWLGAWIIRMNLSPVVVKVRPAWRRLAYRACYRCPSRACRPRRGLAGCHPAPVPAAANGHGGKTRPLGEAGTGD